MPHLLNCNIWRGGQKQRNSRKNEVKLQRAEEALGGRRLLGSKHSPVHKETAPVCTGMPRAQTRIHARTVWLLEHTCADIHTFRHGDTHRCTFGHEPLKLTATSKVHEKSCVGTILHMKTLPPAPSASTPQGTAVVAHSGNLRMWEVEAKGSRVQGDPGLNSKFKASLTAGDLVSENKTQGLEM